MIVPIDRSHLSSKIRKTRDQIQVSKLVESIQTSLLIRLTIYLHARILTALIDRHSWLSKWNKEAVSQVQQPKYSLILNQLVKTKRHLTSNSNKNSVTRSVMHPVLNHLCVQVPNQKPAIAASFPASVRYQLRISALLLISCHQEHLSEILKSKEECSWKTISALTDICWRESQHWQKKIRKLFESLLTKKSQTIKKIKRVRKSIYMLAGMEQYRRRRKVQRHGRASTMTWVEEGKSLSYQRKTTYGILQRLFITSILNKFNGSQTSWIWLKTTWALSKSTSISNLTSSLSYSTNWLPKSLPVLTENLSKQGKLLPWRVFVKTWSVSDKLELKCTNLTILQNFWTTRGSSLEIESIRIISFWRTNIIPKYSSILVNTMSLNMMQSYLIKIQKDPRIVKEFWGSLMFKLCMSYMTLTTSKNPSSCLRLIWY